MSDDKTFPERSATPPEAEHTRAGVTPVPRPDQGGGEDLGPAAALVSSAGKEAAAEAGVADDATEAELAAMGVETESVEAAQILAIMGVTMLAIAVAVVAAISLTGVVTGGEEIEQEAGVTYVTGRELNARADALMEDYRVIDREAGVYGLPIEAAMRRVVETYAGREGLVEAPANFNSLAQVRAVSAVPVRMTGDMEGEGVEALDVPVANEVLVPTPGAEDAALDEVLEVTPNDGDLLP